MADALTTLTGLGNLNGMDSYQAVADSLGISLWSFIVVVIAIGLWVLIWKGLALWKAASKKSIPWFIILLIFNTLGILEILYIFVFSKISLKRKIDSKKKKKK